MARNNPPTTPGPVRYYLGLDPGRGGGLAYVSADGSRYAACNMPATYRDLWQWFVEEDLRGERAFAVVEKVGGFMGPEAGDAADGKGHHNRAAAHVMFKFGTSYGSLLMALTAAGLRHEEVAPVTWQNYLHVPARKTTETKSQWKHRLKQHAQQLFPALKITLKTSDAILIAEYCRRVHSSQHGHTSKEHLP